ncbi:hypothetical protein Q3W71_13345 [Micromonospora sp. C28SCA-DRY-2]|uniref:hypothetical protein n=1 Tax=Micromonospora sp. C28SCA-DRY-2 TaxID=3059522 RepID=UPI002675009F|nr:hypothetical protein [Micromonospora sp. C28SCA-DRY-2]MDO3702654.1 hypothetical protein [Micromonospora sp. C28SCA-DRY-2]
MSEHDAVALAERFARYRTEVLAEVEPPGPAAVRRAVRRRRRRTLGTAVAAVLALGTGPIFGYAALTDPAPRPGPVDPTGTPSASPSATASASPSAAPTSTSPAPTVPDGRISRAQLLATPVSLPPWRPGPSCPVTDTRLAGAATRDQTNVLQGLAYGDVDGDGATETVALVHCLLGTGGPEQVVVFDRDPAGKVITLGRVVATARETPQWLTDVAVRPDGVVRVQVADIAPGGGWPGEWSQRQWRGYRWADGRFAQVEGPTSFGPNPHGMNLVVTATDLVLDTLPDGSRVGTVTVRIRNAGTAPAAYVALRLDLPAALRPDGDGWSACRNEPEATRQPVTCDLNRVEAGAEVRLTLGLRATAGAAVGQGTADVDARPMDSRFDFVAEVYDSDNLVKIDYR